MRWSVVFNRRQHRLAPYSYKWTSSITPNGFWVHTECKKEFSQYGIWAWGASSKFTFQLIVNGWKTFENLFYSATFLRIFHIAQTILIARIKTEKAAVLCITRWPEQNIVKNMYLVKEQCKLSRREEAELSSSPWWYDLKCNKSVMTSDWLSEAHLNDYVRKTWLWISHGIFETYLSSASGSA